MAAVASTSRMQAADLNGPVIDSSYRREDPNFERDREQRRERRPSPSYETGVAPSRERRQTPERAPGNGGAGGGGGYQNNQGGGGGGGGGNGYGGQQRRNNPYMGNTGGNNRGGDYFTERRAQRDASTLSIWPASPKTPRDDSDDSDVERSRKKRKKDKKHKSSSKSKKRSSKHYSDDSDSDSEEEERRRRKKKSKRSAKEDADSDEEYERRKKRKEKKSRSSSKRDRSYSRSKTPVDRVHNVQEEDEWAEKGGPVGGDARLAVATAPADKTGLTSSKGKGKEEEAAAAALSDDDDDDNDVGPKPLAAMAEKSADPREFGGALLRGEGEAMAAFVADGQRIPRRGEIGMESNEIEKFESVGYVMSGSRHRRMNAVRIRKENQVISAEEKRGILKLQKEEKDKKEAMIVGSFKELVERRLEGERKISEKRAGKRGEDDDY